jgi:hypothetical protein
MEFSEIRHRKIVLQGGNDGTKETGGIGCQDDIIHIQQ